MGLSLVTNGMLSSPNMTMLSGSRGLAIREVEPIKPIINVDSVKLTKIEKKYTIKINEINL